MLYALVHRLAGLLAQRPEREVGDEQGATCRSALAASSSAPRNRSTQVDQSIPSCVCAMTVRLARDVSSSYDGLLVAIR